MEIKKQQEIKEVQAIKEVLLVEDYAPHIKMFISYLYQLDFQVEIAKDAKTAIQLLKDRPFTLIITDLDLPDQLGKAVIKEACEGELNQSTPLIVYTTHIDSKKRQECIDWKIDKFLAKPIQIEILEKAIEECFSIQGYERKFDRQLKTLHEEFITIIRELTFFSQKFPKITNEYQCQKKNHVSNKGES